MITVTWGLMHLGYCVSSMGLPKFGFLGSHNACEWQAPPPAHAASLSHFDSRTCPQQSLSVAFLPCAGEMLSSELDSSAFHSGMGLTFLSFALSFSIYLLCRASPLTYFKLLLSQTALGPIAWLWMCLLPHMCSSCSFHHDGLWRGSHHVMSHLMPRSPINYNKRIRRHPPKGHFPR